MLFKSKDTLKFKTNIDELCFNGNTIFVVKWERTKSKILKD